MTNMCSPLFFKVFYNLGLDKKLFFLTVCSATVQDIFISLESPSNITMDIYKTCLNLFDTFYTNKTVRQISVTLSNIEEDVNVQLDLFQTDREKKRLLGYVMDGIRDKYGQRALLRGVSYTNAGTALHRSNLVGGHHS